MGFKRNAPTLVLTFQGELSGLEVQTRTVGRRQYQGLNELYEQFTGERPEGEDAWKAFDALCSAFEHVLVGWNLEDDNGPVPCSADSLDVQGIEFTLALLVGWLAAVEAYTEQLTADTTKQLQELGDPTGFDESSLPMTT